MNDQHARVLDHRFGVDRLGPRLSSSDPLRLLASAHSARLAPCVALMRKTPEMPRCHPLRGRGFCCLISACVICGTQNNNASLKNACRIWLEPKWHHTHCVSTHFPTLPPLLALLSFCYYAALQLCQHRHASTRRGGGSATEDAQSSTAASDLRHMLGKFLASAVRGCMFFRGNCMLINFRFVREFLVDEDRALCPTMVPTSSS